MADGTEITFYANTKIKALLVEWARESDRSVSYIVRGLIEDERQRREDDASNGNSHKTDEKVLTAST